MLNLSLSLSFSLSFALFFSLPCLSLIHSFSCKQNSVRPVKMFSFTLSLTHTHKLSLSLSLTHTNSLSLFLAFHRFFLLCLCNLAQCHFYQNYSLYFLFFLLFHFFFLLTIQYILAFSLYPPFFLSLYHPFFFSLLPSFFSLLLSFLSLSCFMCEAVSRLRLSQSIYCGATFLSPPPSALFSVCISLYAVNTVVGLCL